MNATKQQIWFTSDLHFGHEGVLEYAKRPWANTEDMDNALIRKFNSVVDSSDVVFMLGDISFHKKEHTIEILKSLKGQKFLIKGNHDRGVQPELIKQFAWVGDLYDASFEDIDNKGEPAKQPIVMCHYPMLVWNRCHYGAWMLHGHSHGNLKADSSHKRIDVGVDCWNYAPVSYQTIKEEMSKRGYEQLDHHARHNG